MLPSTILLILKCCPKLIQLNVDIEFILLVLSTKYKIENKTRVCPIGDFDKAFQEMKYW